MPISGKNLTTRHAELKTMLLDIIINSEINAKLPSENSMARRFNVCRATVNKVMVELEREGFVRRLPGKGTFVSPRDKAVHGETNYRGVGTVVLAYPDFFAYSLWQEVHLIEMAALKRKARLINFKMQPETNFKALFELIENCDDLIGIIMIPPSSGLSGQTLQKLDRVGVPCLIRHHLEHMEKYRNIRTIDSDHFKSAYLRAKALLVKGHRNIALLPNEPGDYSRIKEGIRDAFAEYGMVWENLIVPFAHAIPWQDGVETGYHLALKTLDHFPDVTAIIADTFPGAFGVLRALYERNLRCPEDISIITSMEMTSYTRMCAPALSCVNDNPEQLIETMFQVIADPEKHSARTFIIDVTLTERESVFDRTQTVNSIQS